MGTTNFGGQTLLFDYKNPATSTSFNQIVYKLMPSGIYEGGTLTKIDNSRVSISPLLCYVTDEDVEVGIRVITGESAIIAVDHETPYVVLRMDWLEQANNYMDILAVSYANIKDDDLVVGKLDYTSNTVFKDTFDYTLRDIVDFNAVLSQYPFVVIPTNPVSNQVIIQSGTVVTKEGEVDIADTTTSVITDTTNGRVDLIYIDIDGTIKVLEGVDAVSPTVPYYNGRYVIAEIHRGAGRDSVYGSEIIFINPDARIGLTGGGSSGLDWKESVLSKIDFTSVEPVAPSNGDRYINTTTGSSSSTGQSVTINYIYEWNGVNWTETVPNEGATTLVEDEDKIYLFDGTAWGLFDINIDHNSVSNIQGGTTNEYYHLTQNEHSIRTSNYTISWEDTVQYTANEIVEYNGILYLALGSSINHDPESYIGVDWQKLNLGSLDWQSSIIDMIDFTVAEPAAPTLEDRYINTVSGSSSTTTQSVTEDYIYEWNGSSWDEIIPNEGTTTYVEDEKTFYVFDDSTWGTLQSNLNSTLDHNELSTLQGGTTNAYYHLDQYNYLVYNNNYPVRYSSNGGYNIGDIIEEEGVIYQSLQNSNVGKVPSLSPDYWEKIPLKLNDWQESILDRIDLTSAEPSGPTEGDRYINTVTGTSSATAQSVTEDYIYEWDRDQWTETIPTDGTTVYVEDEQQYYVFDDSTWVVLETYLTHNNISGLQGGTANEYYHLTANDYNAYTNSYAMGWNQYTTYGVGDVIEYSGTLYKALQANTNHDPVTYLDVDWEELALGGGAISEHTAGEDITAPEVVALEINTGNAIVASKDDEAKIEVVGFAIENVTTGNTFEVQKAGLVIGFTGLTPGLPCFLSNNGAIIQDDDLIGVGEYRVYLGIAKSATVIDANLGEATYNATSSTTSGEAGSATSEYTAAETITVGDIVAVDSNGQAITADKRYSDHVAVVGVASESVTAGQTLTVTKLGELDQYSGLTAGSVCYLGDNGAVIDDDELIDYDEYRVSVGIVKASTTVDINIGEITLNQLQGELAVRAFIGQVHGGGIYQESTDVMTLRPISLHVNDGIQDWWVEINQETDLSALTNYPAGASSNWFYVLCDRYGNITLEETANGTASERPTDTFYQWGEYGGTGYDHARKGYYHSSYSGKKIVGAIRKVSSGTWYVINQDSEIIETGGNANGSWKIVNQGEITMYGIYVSQDRPLNVGGATEATLTLPVQLSSFSGAASVSIGLGKNATQSPGNIWVTGFNSTSVTLYKDGTYGVEKGDIIVIGPWHE